MRAKDQTGGAFKSFKSNISGIKAGIAGFAAGVGLVALVRNIDEAQKASAQLDAAFVATGRTAGVTRKQIDGLADEIQRTTTVSDDLVKQGAAILLTFTRVRGEAFERTIKAAADLSARLGIDLKSAIRQVGLSLQDPVAGLTLLRRSGISFTESQKNLIKGFLETNQAAKAQDLILSELEKRFGGSAAAARNTLGGALTGLKNSFGDLFEGTSQGTKAAVDSINGISAALNDPDLRAGMNFLIASFAQLVKLAIEALGLIAKTGKAAIELGKNFAEAGKNAPKGIPFLRQAFSNPFAALVGAQFQLNRAASVPTTTESDVAPIVETEKAIQVIEEVRVTVRKIVDENGDLMRELADSTKTGVERTVAEYVKLKETLQFLNDQQLITSRDRDKRLDAALDELLPEFDLNEIRAKYITLKRETSELGEFTKGVWRGVGQSIQATLSDAIFEWRLSWRSLLDITRRALADIGSAIITSGIQKLLKQQLSGGGGGDQSLLADSFFAFLGGSAAGAAGGGRISGVTRVGEEGPELLFGSGTVMNQRQMAFAGMGGAKINYAPTFNLVVQSSGDKDSERRMAEYVETRIAQSQGEFVRVLGRSGLEVKG